MLCLNDYGADMADALSTRVVLIMDRDHKQTIPITKIIDPKKQYKESTKLSSKGIGRFCVYNSAPICISAHMKTIVHDAN